MLARHRQQVKVLTFSCVFPSTRRNFGRMPIIRSSNGTSFEAVVSDKLETTEALNSFSLCSSIHLHYTELLNYQTKSDCQQLHA